MSYYIYDKPHEPYPVTVGCHCQQCEAGRQNAAPKRRKEDTTMEQPTIHTYIQARLIVMEWVTKNGLSSHVGYRDCIELENTIARAIHDASNHQSTRSKVAIVEPAVKQRNPKCEHCGMLNPPFNHLYLRHRNLWREQKKNGQQNKNIVGKREPDINDT